MWRYSLLFLVALPPVAIALNHDVVSLVLIIVWTMLIIPMCIAHSIDYLRKPSLDKRVPPFKLLLQMMVGLFGVLSMFMGGSIILWCLYNVFVKRLPEYSGPAGVLELCLGGFGIASPLLAFGAYLLRLALRRRGEPLEPWSND